MMTLADANRVLQNPRVWDQPTVVEAMEARLEAARAIADPEPPVERTCGWNLARAGWMAAVVAGSVGFWVIVGRAVL